LTVISVSPTVWVTLAAGLCSGSLSWACAWAAVVAANSTVAIRSDFISILVG